MQGIPQGQNPQNSSGGGSQKPSLSWSSPGASHKPAAPQDNKPKPPVQQKPAEKSSQNTSNMTTYVGIFVAGLIVGGLLMWAAAGRGPGVATSTDTTGTSTPSTNTVGSVDLSGSTIAGGLQGLALPSGQEPGATFAISNIDVSQPTWVIVYDDQGGLPGRALGAQLFFPVSQGGEKSGTVSLVRSSLAGHSYLAAERIDDGDHVYNSETDHLVLDSKGQILTVPFTTK